MPTPLPDTRSSLLKKYYPSLDGLRAVAIGLVYMVHFLGAFRQNVWFQLGFVGVDIFFVLSGFLITGILYDSLHRKDYFSNFYIRRTLRIFPLYYGVLTLVFLIGLLPSVHILWDRYNAMYWLYLANLFEAGGKAGLHTEISYLPFLPRGSQHLGYIGIGHLWSLCVEEQFYLVWPAVVWAIRSRKTLLRLCLAVIVIEPFLRWMYAHRHPEMVLAGGLYFATYFRVDTLLAGAAVALWLRGSNPSLVKVRRFAYASVVGVMLLFVLFRKYGGPHPAMLLAEPVIVTFGFSLFALAGVGLLLLTLDPETWPARVLRHRVLVGVGRISYGMYLIHGFIVTFLLAHIAWLHRLHLPGLSVVLIGPAIALGTAWLSFRYFESPFLALKSRLAPRAGAADDPPPYMEAQLTEN